MTRSFLVLLCLGVAFASPGAEAQNPQAAPPGVTPEPMAPLKRAIAAARANRAAGKGCPCQRPADPERQIGVAAWHPAAAAWRRSGHDGRSPRAVARADAGHSASRIILAAISRSFRSDGTSPARAGGSNGAASAARESRLAAPREKLYQRCQLSRSGKAAAGKEDSFVAAGQVAALFATVKRKGAEVPEAVASLSQG